MQKQIDNLDDADADSDIEEINFKQPIAKRENSKRARKIKRSNPHSNLDEDYINRREKLLHPQWESLDPIIDALALFKHFDGKLFQGRLKSVTLDWSKHMLSCAGISYTLRNATGTDITIRLSEPLLKPRARIDLINSMLHQMIHAYLFLLKICEPHGGHGTNFRRIMLTINKIAGVQISTKHTLENDLNYRRRNWWRCNGICQDRGPFFGYVQTQTSCAPDTDCQWYVKHHELCGGTFMRIKSPEMPKMPTKSPRVPTSTNDGNDSNESASEINNSKRTARNNWVAVDEEVMLQEYQETVITLSSDDDDDGEVQNCNGTMTKEERLALIKQEIIDQSLDLCANDFELIGDVCDDNNNVNTIARSGDTKIVEQFFGDNSPFLFEYKTDNDCRPSSSGYHDDADNEIIKCYICEDKLPRYKYGQHLCGCAGISKKILPHRKALKQLSAISTEARPRKRTRPSSHTTREILRNAGYTEAELARISSAEENEEDETLSSTAGLSETSSVINDTSTAAVPEVLNISSEDENTARFRKRNLYKTTRECPVCTDDVEESDMNSHLDICLLLMKPRRSR